MSYKHIWMDGEENASMSNQEALLTCSFGWGKICRLYLDSIEIAGKSYHLDDLISVRPSYRNLFGVPSARLELFFGPRRIVLRGITDPETARLMVSHLRPYCSTQLDTACSRSRASRTRDLVRAQARAWERTSKLPAIPISPEESFRSSSKDPSEQPRRSHASQISPLSALPALDLSFDGRPLVGSSSLCEHLSPESLFTTAETLKSPAQIQDELMARACPWLTSYPGPLHMPRFQPPLRSIHLVPPEQKTLDSGSQPIPAITSSVLPVIHVPVRLQPGECAHYSIGATLCSDRISGSDRAPYPPLDHGLLILTNRRLLYIGKRSQLVLAYTHLWYVSLLHNAIALHIERQFRRIIIEVEHPQEWAGRIEQLSFIARRSRARAEQPTLLIPALPGPVLSSPNAITLKRPALKIQATENRAAPTVAQTPLLAERAESRIVGSETPPLSEQANQQSAHEESHAPSTPPDPEEEIITQALSQSPNLDEITTQDLSQRPASGEKKTEALQLSPAEAEEVETALLHDSTASHTRKQNYYGAINTLPLIGQESVDEEDVPTIRLCKRRGLQPRAISRSRPVSGKLPDLDATPRRFSRVCRSRSYAKEEQHS
jgi:hypothetical protein